MVKKKACKKCRKIYEGPTCTNCGSQDSTTDFKGRVIVFDGESSEIGKNMKLQKPGEYAIKVK